MYAKSLSHMVFMDLWKHRSFSCGVSSLFSSVVRDFFGAEEIVDLSQSLNHNAVEVKLDGRSSLHLYTLSTGT